MQHNRVDGHVQVDYELEQSQSAPQYIQTKFHSRDVSKYRHNRSTEDENEILAPDAPASSKPQLVHYSRPSDLSTPSKQIDLDI